jgi:hypothetical protein
MADKQAERGDKGGDSARYNVGCDSRLHVS